MFETLMDDGWDRYQINFWSIYKFERNWTWMWGTYISFMDIVPTLNESNQQIWNERLNYFKSVWQNEVKFVTMKIYEIN